MAEAYEPVQYWSTRLAQNFDLRGVGHLEYGPGYNDWLYRQKRIALDRALRGRAAGSVALDIGSGIGWVVEYLLDRGFRVTGCDIAGVAVDRLAEQYPAANFFQLAVGSDAIPRGSESFDVITMIDVAYHIVDSDLWGAAVAEMGRVLKPDGQIVITDGLGSDSIRHAEHVKHRSLREWSEAARMAGLRVARVGPLFTWLSRPQGIRGWRRIPNTPRGALEFGLERVLPLAPHMRWAVLVKAD
jgi:SAM-dependent methyltransferase